MADVNGTDQEMLYLCLLKLFKKASNNEFETLQELCKEISDDWPHLKIYNDNTSNITSADDDEAKKQLKTLVEKGRQDLVDYIPVETEGDGSCLFRALSFLCFGHQNRHRELRVRCVIEMATHKERYLDDKDLLERCNAQDAFIRYKNNARRTSVEKESECDTLDPLNAKSKKAEKTEQTTKINGPITANGPATRSAENSEVNQLLLIEGEFTSDVLDTCAPNKYASFMHIQALGVILKKKIKVVCFSSYESEELKEVEKHFNRTLDPKDFGVDLESDEPPLTIMFLLDNEHFVPLIRKEVKEEEDSGRGDSLNDSKAENTTPLETKVKKEKDSGLGDSLLNESTEKDMSPLDESTTKKAKDKASNDANVKNEPNKNIEGIDQEHFKLPHTSTPKKASKERNEQNEDSDDRVDITSADVIDKLNNLLGIKDKKVRLRVEEGLSIETFKSLTGPYQMMIKGILKNVPIKLVTTLIKVQFQIKWNTIDGMPERFNFYDFCSVEKQTEHLNYKPRRAHVLTELYRSAVEKYEDQCKEAVCPDELKEAFCPDVYVRVKDSWARICFSRETCEEVTIEEFKKDFSWMHESLRKFVSEAEKREITLTSDSKNNYSIVTKDIEKRTLYWAVLRDKDFDTVFKSGNHPKLDEISITQVYVGKANGGIRKRWIQDPGSHSEEMMKCMKCVICKQCMKCSYCKKKCSFDAARLKGIQLVDARLLLAKIREENRAVFLIRTFKETDDLKKGEKQHIEGKRIVRRDRNIVLYKDIKDTWIPKEMQYGMNGRS